MSALSEPNYVGDWLKYEEENLYCRKAVTVASGQNLVSGAVVALNADGVTVSAFIDDDGTYGTAAGILLFPVDATSAAKPGVIINRGPAEINSNKLTWHADNDDTEKGKGLTSLLALGIVAKEGA